jgi:hypothetical protein
VTQPSTYALCSIPFKKKHCHLTMRHCARRWWTGNFCHCYMRKTLYNSNGRKTGCLLTIIAHLFGNVWTYKSSEVVLINFTSQMKNKFMYSQSFTLCMYYNDRKSVSRKQLFFVLHFCPKFPYHSAFGNGFQNLPTT